MMASSGRNKVFFVLKFCFYVVGLLYSGNVIIENITKYHDYPSIFTQREDDQISTFPKITLCSYQMHSLWKMRKYYPQINDTILKTFYGCEVDKDISWDKESWEEFNKIDLDEFFQKTMPDIKILHCLFDSLNCTHIWKKRKTKLGICFEFDLYHEVEGDHFLHLSRIDLNSSEHNLGFVIGLNKSDSTYGWYGHMLGMHLYYNYYTDQVEEESKAISLSSQLTPIVNFKLVRNSYLGAPYRECNKSHLQSEYKIYKQNEIYKKSTCEMRQLIDQVVKLCSCRPDYLHNFILEDSPQIRKCNFYDQVKCVSHIIERKGLTKTRKSCKPACQSYEFHQENIQYRISPAAAAGEEHYYMTGVLRTNAERVTVKREQAVYTFNAMMADIGGSLGLILGLSVVKILQMLISFCRRLKHKLHRGDFRGPFEKMKEYFCRKRFRKIPKNIDEKSCPLEESELTIDEDLVLDLKNTANAENEA